MKIIFVCTGNTCRSPMAEGIMKKLCDEHGIIAEIKSAGIFVNDIDGVAENAVLAAAEHGIDISAHTPTQLTPDMMSAADIIAPMTEAQADLLIGAGVENDKIYRFAHPVADPYMGTRERYSACFDELYDAIKTMIKDLFDDTTTD